MTIRRRLDLFCRVVDNFGDIGICWRLARQLQHEQAIDVTLWVDNLAAFQRICPAVLVDAPRQQVAQVQVRHWADQDGVFAPADVADLVIEFFGCDIPPGYIAAMALCQPRPQWFNLEGLSAEAWVEGCHRLPSSHPRLPLTKYFFFPGFTASTGGLLREAALERRRAAFQADPAAMAAFLAPLGVTAAEMAAFKVSLFCYPHAPVSHLLQAWQEGATAITCLVPEGVAQDAVQAFLGAGVVAQAGAVARRGALTLRVLPFVPQPDYDLLLWSCDLNFVRGEDSIVRAQWAARPFVWHIYPQDENLHHVKLRAFLQRYSPGLAPSNDFALRWNGAAADGADAPTDWAALWSGLQGAMPEIGQRSVDWQREMLQNGDLATNLLTFSRSLGSVAPQN